VNKSFCSAYCLFVCVCFGCVYLVVRVCAGQQKNPQKCVFWETLLKVFFYVFPPLPSATFLLAVIYINSLSSSFSFGRKISKWNCCIICTFRIFICVSHNVATESFLLIFGPAGCHLAGKRQQSVNKYGQNSFLSKQPTKRKLKLKCWQDIRWIIQKLLAKLLATLFLYFSFFFFLYLFAASCLCGKQM